MFARRRTTEEEAGQYGRIEAMVRARFGLPADALVLSSRNLPGVRVVADSHLTAYDALDCVHLVVSQEAAARSVPVSDSLASDVSVSDDEYSSFQRAPNDRSGHPELLGPVHPPIAEDFLRWVTGNDAIVEGDAFVDDKIDQIVTELVYRCLGTAFRF